MNKSRSLIKPAPPAMISRTRRCQEGQPVSPARSSSAPGSTARPAPVENCQETQSLLTFWLWLLSSTLISIPLTSLHRRCGFRFRLPPICPPSVARKFLDEVFQRFRIALIDVDPGFLAQNQAQQCFQNIAAAGLTLTIFATSIADEQSIRHQWLHTVRELFRKYIQRI